MQRCPTHACAGQSDGFEFRHRCDHAGAAHLAGESQQPAGSFFRRVLQGNGPARCFLREASAVLQTQVVEFHNHTVCGVIKIVPPTVPGVEKALHRGEIWQQGGIGIHSEAGGFQPAQAFPLAGRSRTFPVIRQVQCVREEIKPSRGHHPGIELAQGAGTGIAGVGEQRFIPRCSVSVDGREGAIGNQSLAAHLHPGRWGIDLQSQRDRCDGAHIGGDLLALFPVSAGGAPDQQPVLIAEGKGIAVNFEFSDHGQCRRGSIRSWLSVKHLQQACIPAAQFFSTECVVQAEEGNAMGHAGESLGGSSTHALGGAVGDHQLGVSGLQIQQFAIKAVVDRVLHLGSIQHVIGVGCSGEQLPQFSGALIELIRRGL